MSDPSDRRDDAADVWVVDVTAPLATGRVREVAADAAARLKLPVEKLVALLENRIGPVTKPLPRASAERVAEVLDLAGADVTVRPATEAEVRADPRSEARTAVDSAHAADANAVAGRPTDPHAADADAAVVDGGQQDAAQADASDVDAAGVEASVAEVAEAAAGTASEDARTTGAVQTDRDGDAGAAASQAEPPSRERTPVASERDAIREAADTDPASLDTDAAAPSDPLEPTPPIGRAGRVAAAPRERARHDRTDDPWSSLDTEDDEAMLGDWRRTPPPTASPAREPLATSPSAAESGPPGGAPVQPTTPAPSGRTPIAERPPVQEQADDDNEWAYGLRDPFAEAEARERALRRWVLMIALLVASTVFVALQWAYSRSGPSDRTPPTYAEGLAAYRDGAFVSAARAWTPRAEAGDVQAMYMLGWMAEFGQGRPWSNREAASWYRQAADRGHAPSQERLARLYREGLGVDRDADAALRWSLAAAEAGRPHAQREAALALAHAGRLEEARAWLARAANRDPEAAAWWALAVDAGAATSDSR